MPHTNTFDYSFGNWIKRRCKALDLTQPDLAARVGYSISLIFKIESDERRPSRQITELLAEHLEIPLDQHDLFLKMSRQEKAVDGLESLSPQLRQSTHRPPRLRLLPLSRCERSPISVLLKHGLMGRRQVGGYV